MRRINTVMHLSFLCTAMLLLSVGPAHAGSPFEQTMAPQATAQCQAPELDLQTPLEKIVGSPEPVHYCQSNVPCQTDWDCRDTSTGKLVLGWCRTLGDYSYCVCP